MNTLTTELEINLSQRFCILAAAHTVAAKYPTVTITQSKAEPWVYDLHCLYHEFDRLDVPLEHLIPRVEDMVTTLMAYHPGMLETVAESRAKLHQEKSEDKP